MGRPTLWIDHKTGEVKAHEGRHRARAAVDNKLGMIPVDVVGNDKHESVRHIPFHKIRGQRSISEEYLKTNPSRRRMFEASDSPDQKKRRSDTARKVRQGMESLKASLKPTKQQMKDEEDYMVSQGEIPEVKTLPNQFWEKHGHEDSPHIKYLKIHKSILLKQGHEITLRPHPKFSNFQEFPAHY